MRRLPASKWRARLDVLLCGVALATLAAIVCQPLVGLPPKGHDTLAHFYRLPELASLLERGTLFSRWLPDLHFGYGYPLFNFHPPLETYWFLSSYWLAGGHALAGWNAAFAPAFVIAIVGMFRLGRELYDAPSALLATAAYVLAPHFLYHTFARGSLSNALAVSLAPLAALGLVRAARAPSWRRVASAALAIAALLLAHAAAGLLMLVPLLALGSAAASAVNPEDGRRSWAFGAVASATTLGLAGAAFSWLPGVAELGHTHYQAATSSLALDLRLHFADLLAWPSPAIVGLANADLPITVGVGQLALGIVGAELAAVRLVGDRRHGSRPHSASDRITAAAGLVALGAVVLASPPSLPLWSALPFLQHLQFPWRWLDAAGLMLGLASGGLLFSLAKRPAVQTGLAATSLLVFFLNALPYLYPPRWQSLPDHPTLADVTRVQQRWGIYGLTSWNEFLPASVPSPPTGVPFAGADLGASLDRKLRREPAPPDGVTAVEGGPMQAVLKLDLEAPGALVFETFYFPGWTATVDGRTVPVDADEFGLLRVSVPAGEHVVEVRFGETIARAAADATSLLAALAILVLFLAPRSDSGPRPARAPSTARAASPLPPLIVCAAVLLVLAGLKLTWLDRVDSPLVRHPRGGGITGTSTPRWRRFGGDLELLGYSLTGRGEAELYWRAERPPARDYVVQILLADASGQPVSMLTNRHPGHGLTSRWETGQLVRDAYPLPAGITNLRGSHRLTVSLLDPDDGQALPLLDSPDGAALGSSLENE